MAVFLIVAAVIIGLPLLCLIFLFLASVFVKKEFHDKDSPFYRILLNFIVDAIMFFSNVKVDFEGENNLPENGRFLIVSNHLSNFDPIVTWKAMRKYKLTFVSKPENFKIPIANGILRKCCAIAIDRENPRNAITAINQAADLLKRGEVSVGIYPEGTRNKTDDVLLPFHTGVFKIAQKAKVPVVAAVVKNTEKVHKNAPFKRTKVTVKILKTFSAEYACSLKSKDLGEEVRNLMEEELSK